MFLTLNQPAAAMELQQRYYLPQLNAIRIFVILWVVADHVQFHIRLTLNGLETIFPFAWLGVDLLFVHGAFIFAIVLQMERVQNGHANYVYFYMRRILRIFPLYFAYILLVMLYFRDSIVWTDYTVIRFIGLLTFTDNLMGGWYGKLSPLPYTAHLYTVSMLMQVYLLVPIIFHMLDKYRFRKKVIIVALVMVTAMLMRSLVIASGGHFRIISMSPFFQPEAVFLGMLLAYFVTQKAEAGIRTMRILFAVWLLAFAVIAHHIAYNMNVNGGDLRLLYIYPLAAIFLTGILWSTCTMKKGSTMANILSNPVFDYLGKIIFGLYIYHLACIPISVSIMRKLSTGLEVGYQWLAVVILTLILTTAVASLSYYGLERPFLKLKGRFSVVRSQPV